MAERDGSKDAPSWGNISADRLQSVVSRIERLEEERRAITGDIADIYKEASSSGFVVPVLKRLVSLRRKADAEVEEQETLIDVYRRALKRGTGTLAEAVRAAVPDAVQDELGGLPARSRRSTAARETEPVL